MSEKSKFLPNSPNDKEERTPSPVPGTSCYVPEKESDVPLTKRQLERKKKKKKLKDKSKK
jgi:hypothetical protein